MKRRTEWTVGFKRIGLCCGPCVSLEDQVLYRVYEHRYRCAECFKAVTGHNP